MPASDFAVRMLGAAVRMCDDRVRVSGGRCGLPATGCVWRELQVRADGLRVRVGELHVRHAGAEVPSRGIPVRLAGCAMHANGRARPVRVMRGARGRSRV